MAPDDFYRDVVDRLDHHPFEPFVVELNDGRRIEFARPTLAIRGGAAGGFDTNGDIVFLDSDEVKQIVKGSLAAQPNADRS